MSKNPWQTLRQKRIYQDHWLSLRKDKVKKPDGTEGVYSVIEHQGGVAIAAITENAEIYLVGEWKYPIAKYLWTVCAGGVEKGETGLSAAKRELEEEVGLLAKKWTALGYFYASPGATDEKVYVFLAQNLTPIKRKLDTTEKIKIRKVSFSKAISMVAASQINDSYAVVAILKSYSFLNRKGG